MNIIFTPTDQDMFYKGLNNDYTLVRTLLIFWARAPEWAIKAK